MYFFFEKGFNQASQDRLKCERVDSIWRAIATATIYIVYISILYQVYIYIQTKLLSPVTTIHPNTSSKKRPNRVAKDLSRAYDGKIYANARSNNTFQFENTIYTISRQNEASLRATSGLQDQEMGPRKSIKLNTYTYFNYLIVYLFRLNNFVKFLETDSCK